MRVVMGLVVLEGSQIIPRKIILRRRRLWIWIGVLCHADLGILCHTASFARYKIEFSRQNRRLRG